jgi:hypothetical protein
MDSAIVGGLIQAGALGIVAAWFMFRAESRIEGLRRDVNRLALVIALEIATRQNAPEATKVQARELIEEIKALRQSDPMPT